LQKKENSPFFLLDIFLIQLGSKNPYFSNGLYGDAITFLLEIKGALKMNCAKIALRFKILKEVVKCVQVSCALL